MRIIEQMHCDGATRSGKRKTGVVHNSRSRFHTFPPLTEHPLIKVVGHVHWLLAVVQAVQIPAFRGGGVKLDECALPRDWAEAVSL